MLLVTGGAGFIGSNFVNEWFACASEPLHVVDKLTYAGNPENLSPVAGRPGFGFTLADICDEAAISALLDRLQPRAIVHFAAESHVDRSIAGPQEFIHTNVNGSFSLLQVARAYLARLGPAQRESFRFVHISTDEVFGSLSEGDPPFSETTPYAPNSPYAASKAASDHLVRAYWHTYRLPALTVNCSNNYGPLQFPEKLIPLVIVSAIAGQELPVYGDGRNIRDWLFVHDHCAAIRLVLERGRPGETYNVGGRSERRNIDVVNEICRLLDEFRPLPHGRYADQIRFVRDRPGHDRRYAIDAGKLERELGWVPSVSFEEGLRRTVRWYLDHTDWVRRVRDGSYRNGAIPGGARDADLRSAS